MQLLISFLILFVTMTASTAVFLLGSVLVAFTTGLRIKEVQLTFGKPWLRFRIGVVPVVIGKWPFGGAVNWEDGESLQKLSPGFRLLLAVAGPLAVLVFAATCVQYDVAATEFLSGFRQIVQGALSPLSAGRHLVGEFFHLAQAAPVPSTVGVFAAKIAAFHMLPIPSTSGGSAVLSLIPGANRSRPDVPLLVAGLFVVLGILGSWCVAVCAYVWGMS